jgi:hypothetical protein
VFKTSARLNSLPFQVSQGQTFSNLPFQVSQDQSPTDVAFQVSQDQTQSDFLGFTRSNNGLLGMRKIKNTVWLPGSTRSNTVWLPGITGSNIACLLKYYKIKKRKKGKKHLMVSPHNTTALGLRGLTPPQLRLWAELGG